MNVICINCKWKGSINNLVENNGKHSCPTCGAGANFLKFDFQTKPTNTKAFKKFVKDKNPPPIPRKFKVVKKDEDE